MYWIGHGRLSSGVKPVREGEGAHGFRRGRSARIVPRRRRRAMLDQRDRVRPADRAGSSGCGQFEATTIKFISARRSTKSPVRLRPSFQTKTACRIERDRREERDAGRNVADIESDLGERPRENSPACCASLTPNAASVEAGVEPPTRRSCAPLVSSISEEHHASHVGQDHPAFRDGGAPLHLDGVGAIDPLGRIFLTPARSAIRWTGPPHR